MPAATKAKIASRPDTKNTGLTPEVARKFADRLGTSTVAIVEIFSEENTVGIEGDRTVKLTLGSIEPATDRETAEHLREFARALYRAREPQQTIEHISKQEPSVADLIKHGQLLLVDAEIDDDGQLSYKFGGKND